MAGELSFEVRLAASADEVWARVTTFEGINDELGRWLRMTTPRGGKDASLADLDPPVTLGWSWLLLLGVVPFDGDRVHIESLGDRSFAERSTMVSASWWHHDRSVVPDGTGCVVQDRVDFELRRPLRRLPGSARLHRAIVTRIFVHRHARLVERFGSHERPSGADG